jgi:DNA-binding MurR/RpiR family transcriptional regulator
VIVFTGALEIPRREATGHDREWRAVGTLVDARELTIAEIATQYDVSPATIYRRLSS